MPLESDVMVFQDVEDAAAWRVEHIDDDGGCYVTVTPSAQ
jgi:hypothetical protein